MYPFLKDVRLNTVSNTTEHCFLLHTHVSRSKIGYRFCACIWFGMTNYIQRVLIFTFCFCIKKSIFCLQYENLLYSLNIPFWSIKVGYVTTKYKDKRVRVLSKLCKFKVKGKLEEKDFVLCFGILFSLFSSSVLSF